MYRCKVAGLLVILCIAGMMTIPSVQASRTVSTRFVAEWRQGYDFSRHAVIEINGVEKHKWVFAHSTDETFQETIDTTISNTIKAYTIYARDDDLQSRYYGHLYVDGNLVASSDDAGPLTPLVYVIPAEQPPPPTCGEGAVRNVVMCPDGVNWKQRELCRNNNWVPEYQTCPAPPPTCSEGSVRVLETCPDGSTWKHRQVCRNNAWVDEYQQCPAPAEYGITKISRVYYDPFRRDIVDVSGTVVKNGDSFDVQLTLKNLREGFYQVRVYRAPVYFTSDTLVYHNLIWPHQTLNPFGVETPEFSGGSQICIDVELDTTMEAVRFLVDMFFPAPNPLSYGQQFVWLKSELVSHMVLGGYLPSDYESKPDAIQFLSGFSDLCSKEPDYVLRKLSEFGANCYITFEKEGLKQAIKDFASKLLLPFKLFLWNIHVMLTPATEIIYVDIGKKSASGAG